MTQSVGGKPLINLSIIEEEDKLQADHTLALNSNSDNDVRRNFSGFQDDLPKNLLKQASSSHSLAINSGAAPKIQKKSSFDVAQKNKKTNLTIEILDEKPPNEKTPDNKKTRSISEYQKSNNEEKNPKDSEKIMTERTLASEKKLPLNNEILPGQTLKDKEKAPLKLDVVENLASKGNTVFADPVSVKKLKFTNEMKNFVRKKCTPSEFQVLLLGFLKFNLERNNSTDEKVLLSSYTRFWCFFYQGIQIVLYLQKESKSLINKFKKNLKDSMKIKESFQKYHRTEEIEDYLLKRKWKGYLEELLKCQELNEEILTKVSFLSNFLGHYLDDSLEKPSEPDFNENSLNDKVMEIFGSYESNLKTLNSYAGLTAYSEERLAILTKIDKKESFMHFVDFFNEDVKTRHLNDLKVLLAHIVGYMKKISVLIDRENGRERQFHKNLHENCLLLTELATILTKKVEQIFLLKKSTNDKISSLLLPFYEHREKNLAVIIEAEKKFMRILHKIKKTKKKVKYSRDHFPNNFFLNLREKHCITLLLDLETIEVDTHQDLEMLVFFQEYPNYELEILNIQTNCQQFQEDFKSNEEKEQIADKVIWLAGKLHNMRVFLKDLEMNEGSKNALLKILQTSLQTHLSATYKLYDFLLKILNSAHAAELQKIKLIEGDVEKLLDILTLYYETLDLPMGFRTDEALIEMKAHKMEIENYSLLLDLPDIYRDICSAKITQLEQEIDKLETFEALKEKGKEKVDNNGIRNVILSLTYEKKSSDLENLIKNLEKFLKISSYIVKINSSIQAVLSRINDILDLLRVFEEVYTMFFLKFLNISDNYEDVKKVVWTYKEVLIEKLISKIGRSNKKEDKQFFLQCAEFFFLNTKNFFQTLVPENIEHIFAQTNQLQREVKGKIDNFYENRENMNVMAVGYTRQLNIIKICDQFLKILERLDQGDLNTVLKIKKTKESLIELKVIIDVLLKPCEVASLFEDFLDDLVKNKNLNLDLRIDKLKEMIKDLNEKLKVLEQEERKGIKDKKISGIYVYIKDDIRKVNDYITILMPDIEEYAKFQYMVEKNKFKIILDDNVMQQISKLYDFKERIDKTTGANQKLIFHDQSKINHFIQEYYLYWYEHIHYFLKSFDFEAIAKILQCYNAANQRNLQKIMDDYVKLFEKLASKYVDNKNLLITECKDVRRSINLIKNNVNEVDLAIFILSNIKIDEKKYRNLNVIHGMKEFFEIAQEKFRLELWKDITSFTYKICDKFCSNDSSKSLYKTLLTKEIKIFEEKYGTIEIPQVHKKWVDLIVKLFK